MIEIRTLKEGPQELAAFTNRVWRQSYQGRMMVPLWSKDFFQRELMPHEGFPRDFLVAAYDGTRLIGSHPARPVTARLHAETIAATWGSFVTVDPDYRRQGVAQKMQEEFIRRHRERERLVDFGYLYIRSVKSMGPKFWLRQEGTRIVRKVGMWVRPLDHSAVARFELHRIEAWGCRFWSLFQGAPRAPSDPGGIRDYAHDDLVACRELLEHAGQSADLAYQWDDETLGRQLCSGDLGRTLVLERQGRVEGLVNYTLLEVLGRCPILLALIDAVALGSLARKDRRRLWAGALSRMAADGAHVAMMLRGSWQEFPELLAAGFLPLPPEYYYIGTKMFDRVSLEGVRRVHVFWR